MTNTDLKEASKLSRKKKRKKEALKRGSSACIKPQFGSAVLC
jgi:hypothetical protein